MQSIKLSVVRLPTYHSAAITVKEEELEGSVLTEAQRLLDDSLLCIWNITSCMKSSLIGDIRPTS